MDKEDRQILKKLMLELVTTVKVTTSFKAHLYSREVLEDEALEKVLENEDPEDLVLNLVMAITKGPAAGLDRFIEALENAGQREIAKRLREKRVSKDQSGAAVQVGGASWVLPEGEDETSTLRKNNDKNQNQFGSDATALSEPRSSRQETAQLSDNFSTLTVKPSGSESSQARSASGNLEDERKELLAVIPERNYAKHFGDIVTTDHYFDKCRDFAKGKRSKRPGPFENPRGPVSIPNGSVKKIPPQCSAVICRLFGGRPELRYHNLYGGENFVTTNYTPKYFGVNLYLQPKNVELTGVWLSAEATLIDAIAASLGWYPSKIMGRGNKEFVLEGATTVHQWYKGADTAILDVWNFN